MDHRDILGGIVSPEAFLAGHEICSTRRGLLVAPRRAVARSVGRGGDCRHNQPVGDSDYPSRRDQVGRLDDRFHETCIMEPMV
jgi:hypothetical protein